MIRCSSPKVSVGAEPEGYPETISIGLKSAEFDTSGELSEMVAYWRARLSSPIFEQGYEHVRPSSRY